MPLSDGVGDDLAPVLLGAIEHVLEKRIEHQVPQARVAARRPSVMRFRNLARMMQPPRQMAAMRPRFEAPVFLLAHRLDEVEALGVADDLGGVERVVDLLRRVHRVVDGGFRSAGPARTFARGDPLFLQRRRGCALRRRH